MGSQLKTLHQLFYEKVEEQPQRTAIFLPDGAEVSRAQLWEQACRLRAHLEAAGLGPGERVALVGLSSPAYAVALWATLAAGATAVPLNYRLPAEDLAWMVADCQARALLADRRYLELLSGPARQLAQEGCPVVCFDGPWQESASFEETQKAEPSQAQRRPHETALDEPIFVLYTSGTTARPKGVAETHRGYAITATGPSPIPPESVRYLHALPLYHLAGMAALMTGLARGGQMVLLDRFAPETFLEALARFEANCTFLVPTMMCDLVEFPGLDGHDTKSMKIIAYGAAPTPVPVLVKMIERFRCFFIQLYSQTEGTSRVTMLGPEDHFLSPDPARREKQLRRLSSIGKVMEGVEAKVCDEAGAEVSQGQVGELWYRTPGAMREYVNRVEDTRATLVDGWIRSGDMVRTDQDGYVYIVGRAKDFLIRGGENIAPREIEEALEAHPAVAEAAVVGRPDERWGEAVVAFVRCPNGQPAEAELIAHCRGRLAGFKVPERVWVRRELPRNAVGKILKRELAEEARTLG